MSRIQNAQVATRYAEQITRTVAESAQLPAAVTADLTRRTPADPSKLKDGKVDTIDAKTGFGKEVASRINNARPRAEGAQTTMPSFLVGDLVAKLPTGRSDFATPAIGDTNIPGLPGNDGSVDDPGKSMLNDLINANPNSQKSQAVTGGREGLEQYKNGNTGEPPISQRQRNATEDPNNTVGQTAQGIAMKGFTAIGIGTTSGGSGIGAITVGAGLTAAEVVVAGGAVAVAGAAGAAVGVGINKAFEAVTGRSQGELLAEGIEKTKEALPFTEAGKNDKEAEAAHDRKVRRDAVKEREAANNDKKTDNGEQHAPDPDSPLLNTDTRPAPNSIADEYGPAPSKAEFEASVREIYNGLTNPRGLEGQRPHVDPETLQSVDRVSPRQGFAINWGPDGQPPITGDAPLPDNGVADPPEGFGGDADPTGPSVKA